MVVLFVKSNENTYPKGKALMQCTNVQSCPYNEKREWAWILLWGSIHY